MNEKQEYLRRVQPFEEHARRYDAWFERHTHAFASEILAIKKVYPFHLHSEVPAAVEIGVGTGRFARELGVKLGVEPSRKMAEIASQRGIEVVRGVAEALPFKDACFDLALFIATLCFVFDAEAALSEANRVLRHGGFVLVAFIERESPLGRAYKRKGGPFYAVAHFYTTEEVVSLLKSAGFRNFAFAQTLFGANSTVNSTVEAPKDGYGEGSFIVVRAEKV